MNPGAQHGLMTPELGPHPGLQKSVNSFRSSTRTTPQSVIDELQYNNRRPRASGKSPRTEDLVRKKAESEERFRNIVSSFKPFETSAGVCETGSPKARHRSEDRRRSKSDHERDRTHPIDRSSSSQRKYMSMRDMEDEGYQIDHNESSEHRRSKHKKRRSKSSRSSKSRSSSKVSLPGVSSDGVRSEKSWGINSVVSDSMEKWTHFDHSESEFSESASDYDPHIDSFLSPVRMTPNSLAAKSLLLATSDTPSGMRGSAGFPDARSLRHLVMMDNSSETQLSRSSSRRSSKEKKRNKSSRSESSSRRSSRSSSKASSPKSPPRHLGKKTESIRSEGTYLLPTPSVIAAGVQQVADKLEVNMLEGSPSSPNTSQDKVFGLFLNDDDSAKLRKKAARNASRRSNVRRRRKQFTPEGSELELHDDETMSTISYDPVLDLLAAAKVHEDAIQKEARGSGDQTFGDNERVLSEDEKQKILTKVVEVAKQQKMMEKAKFNSSRNLEDVLEASLEGGDTTEDESPSKQSGGTPRSHLESSPKRCTVTPTIGVLSTNEVTSVLSSQELTGECVSSFVDVEANRPTVRLISDDSERKTLKQTFMALAKNSTFLAIVAVLTIFALVVIAVVIALNRPTAVIDDPTQPPAQSANPLSDDEVLSLITRLSPSDPTLLEDIESPQGRASAWLRKSSVFKSDRNQIIQRYSLATLFFATDGENWMNKEGWLSDIHECDWFSSHGKPCDDNGNFRQLELRQNRLNGVIPEELSLLTSISSILFPGNALLGSFPTSLTNLGSLNYLDLDNNEYERQFPLSILALTNLKYLSLSLNRFTGDLPTGIGALSKLETLVLAGNRFTSGLPVEVTALTDLTMLNVEYNEMSGPIITEIGLMRNLEHLKLDFNVFNLAVPSEIGLLAKLRTFGCNECSLFGVLPTEIGFLGFLEAFELQSNQLTGSLPREMGTMTSLRRLNLAENSLDGSLPTDLGRLIDIESFDVSLNRLTGTIPTEFGSIRSNSFIFYLGSNSITGSIPQQVCQLLIENEGKMLVDPQIQVCNCESCNSIRSMGARGSGWKSQISRGFDIFGAP